MNFYAGTLGQLVIVEIFVLIIWLQVLFEAIKTKDSTVAHKRFLLTSIGLVLNAAAIAGIMVIRIWQLVENEWPFIWGVVGFYVLLAAGNIMFIIAASLGGSPRLLKAFLVTTALWTAYVIYATFK